MKDQSIGRRLETAAYAILVVGSLAAVLYSMSSAVEVPDGSGLAAAWKLRTPAVHAAEPDSIEISRELTAPCCTAEF